MNSNPSPGLNTVMLHADYIEVIWDGAQTVEKVQKSNGEALAAAGKLRNAHKPVMVSILIKNHPLMPNMKAFNEVLKMFRATTFDRVAICGTIPASIMSLVSTIISSFDKELDIAYFTGPDEALAWLKKS